jgi:hypothetical protein
MNSPRYDAILLSLSDFLKRTSKPCPSDEAQLDEKLTFSQKGFDRILFTR